VFTGFANQYALRAAGEQFDAANARTEFTRQQIVLQVFTSYYALQTATERVRTSANLLASAEESERVARGRYTEGVGSIVDLLIAQSALASARAQAVSARWQWRSALAQLAHDAGVLGIHGESLIPLGKTPGGPQ
jgi:outer membrane protein TolC